MAKRGSIQISHQDKVNSFFFDIFLYYYKHLYSFFSRDSVGSRNHLACEQGQESQIFAARSRVIYDSLTCVHACEKFMAQIKTLASREWGGVVRVLLSGKLILRALFVAFSPCKLTTLSPNVELARRASSRQICRREKIVHKLHSKLIKSQANFPATFYQQVKRSNATPR